MIAAIVWARHSLACPSLETLATNANPGLPGKTKQDPRKKNGKGDMYRDAVWVAIRPCWNGSLMIGPAVAKQVPWKFFFALYPAIQQSFLVLLQCTDRRQQPWPTQWLRRAIPSALTQDHHDRESRIAYMMTKWLRFDASLRNIAELQQIPGTR